MKMFKTLLAMGFGAFLLGAGAVGAAVLLVEPMKPGEAEAELERHDEEQRAIQAIRSRPLELPRAATPEDEDEGPILSFEFLEEEAGRRRQGGAR